LFYRVLQQRSDVTVSEANDASSDIDRKCNAEHRIVVREVPVTRPAIVIEHHSYKIGGRA
jgi:hypothetical protein